MTDFTRTRGDTYGDVYALTDTATGEPLDLTGCSFLLTLDRRRSPPDTSTQLYSLSGNVLDAAAGKVEFAPTASQANQLGSFYFDMQMIDVLGRCRTLDSGKYRYTQDITKA
jgi:hypothetical protein